MKYQHKLNETERCILLAARGVVERLEKEITEKAPSYLPFERVEMETEGIYLSEAKQMLGALATPALHDARFAGANQRVDPELVWLRWFYKNVRPCLGPSDGDIYESLKNEFDDFHTTVKVPASYREE